MILLGILAFSCGNEPPENSNKVEPVLYLGQGDRQPLIVALGGGEGGNAWTSDRWKKTRDRFIDEGYALLAIGYFGAKCTAADLDRISIDAVHDAIVEAGRNSKVDGEKVAIIGGSKGAELALLLASHFSEIDCVVALVPGNCAFPALTMSASTSSWTFQGEEVPYVPMPWAAVPAAMKKDLRSAFEIMLEDSAAAEKALIKVEDINGSILLLSATEDEFWPSKEMSDAMMERLDQYGFDHRYKHIVIDGRHTDVLDHFDSVFDFLELNFPTQSK